MPPFFPARDRARAYGLTDCELEVLCLTAEGLTSKEAGIRLGISESTIRGHLAKAAASWRHATQQAPSPGPSSWGSSAPEPALQF
jgi:FixJ family two-component response regulator